MIIVYEYQLISNKWNASRAELVFIFFKARFLAFARPTFYNVAGPRPAYANFNLLGARRFQCAFVQCTDIVIPSPQPVDNNIIVIIIIM